MCKNKNVTGSAPCGPAVKTGLASLCDTLIKSPHLVRVYLDASHQASGLAMNWELVTLPGTHYQKAVIGSSSRSLKCVYSNINYNEKNYVTISHDREQNWCNTYTLCRHWINDTNIRTKFKMCIRIGFQTPTQFIKLVPDFGSRPRYIFKHRFTHDWNSTEIGFP